MGPVMVSVGVYDLNARMASLGEIWKFPYQKSWVSLFRILLEQTKKWIILWVRVAIIVCASTAAASVLYYLDSWETLSSFHYGNAAMLQHCWIVFPYHTWQRNCFNSRELWYKLVYIPL